MKLFFFSFLFLSLVIFIYFNFFNKKESKHDYIVYLAQKAFSADPIDFDLWTHHYIFNNVLARLITQYKKGEVIGVIAEKWVTSNN